MNRDVIQNKLNIGYFSLGIAQVLCRLAIMLFLIVFSQTYNAFSQCPIANNIAVCNEDVSAVDLNSLLINEPSSGEWFWAGQGESPSGFRANNSNFDPVGMQPGPYTFGYNFKASDQCIKDGTTYAIVNVMPTPVAGEGLSIQSCNESNIIELETLLVGADRGGKWYDAANPVGGIFDEISGTFNPVGGRGKYEFIYALDTDNCPVQEATVTINVISYRPNTGESSNIKICSDTEENIDLFSLLAEEDFGGIWTELATNPEGGQFEPDGTFSPVGASFNPPNNVYGFSYTFPNCSGESIVYITINERKNTGIANDITVCTSAADIDLFDLLTGNPDSGGTWIADQDFGFTEPSTFVPSDVAPGIYAFKYAFSDIEGCGVQETTVTINVIDQPSVGVDGEAYICRGGVSTVNLFDIIVNEEIGGQWTDVESNMVIENPEELDIENLVDGIYQYEYQSNIYDGCLLADVSIATLIVDGAQPDPGPGGFVLSCQGIVDLTGQGNFITSEGGKWIDISQTGLDLLDPTQVDASTLAIGTYSFVYRFGSSFGCHETEAIITLEISGDPPSIGADVAAELCESMSTNLDLFDLLGQTVKGGEWFDENNNQISNIIDVAQLQIDDFENLNYSYRIGAAQNCTPVSTNVALTLWELNSAGQDMSLQICAGNGTLNLLDLIPGIETGGSWVITGANSNLLELDQQTAILDYSTANSGTYFISYTQEEHGVCTQQQSILTLTISDDVQQLQNPLLIRVHEGSTNDISIFSAIENNGASTGGIFTLIQGNSEAFDLQTGLLNPSNLVALESVIIEYSFEGNCDIDPEQITIEIVDGLNAGIATNTTLCKDYAASTLINFWDQLEGFDEGGQWIDNDNSGLDLSDPSAVNLSNLVEGNYSFTYQFYGSSEHELSTATFVLSCVSQEPIQGYNKQFSICEGDEEIINFINLLQIKHTGGNWIDVDNSGLDLSNPAMVNLSALEDGSYKFTYLIEVLGDCSENVESSLLITVAEQNSAGENTTFTLCGDYESQPDFMLDTGGDEGGIWESNSSNPPGSAFLNGMFIPSNAFPGTYQFSYRFDNGSDCTSSEAFVTVYVIDGVPQATGLNEPIMVCEGETNTENLTDLLTPNSQLGGVFQPSNGTVLPDEIDFNPQTGIIETTNLIQGIYVFEYTFENTLCAENTTVLDLELVIKGSSVGENGAFTICDHGNAIVDLSSILGIEEVPIGGIWTDLSGTYVDLSNPSNVDLSFLPIGKYEFQLSVNNDQVPCSPEEAIATVYISAQPSAGNGSKHEICAFDEGELNIDLNSLLNGPDEGGKWSGPQPEDGGVFNPSAGTVQFTSASTIRTYVYTYSFDFDESSPCDNDAAEIIIKVTDDCAQTTPCLAAQRFDAGSSWTEDGSIDDSSISGGVVKCGTDGSFMTLEAPTYIYDPTNFEIEFNNKYYNPHTGYMMSPSVPQVGEDIIWINFDVRPLVSSFQLFLDDDEDLAWALYLSNNHSEGTSIQSTATGNSIPLSGNCSSLTFIRSGISSEFWQSIIVDDADFSVPKNYYLAIWDGSSNVNIGDGPNGLVVNAFGARMGCENTDECIAPILLSTPEITDLRNETYSVTIEVGGLNGMLEAIDLTGNALSVSSPVCVSNALDLNGVTSAEFELIYPHNINYEIEVGVINSSSCRNPKNSNECSSVILAPPTKKLSVNCPSTPDRIYGSFDEIPEPDYNAVQIINNCGNSNYDINHGDIIRQTGPQTYEIERVFTVFSGCTFPGNNDDQYASCSILYQVEFEYIPHIESCGLACTSNGVNIGIDDECSAYIRPEILLEGDVRDCLDNYYVVLSDPENNNELIPNPIGKQYIGKTIQAQVFELGSPSDNSCWGNITLEDKKPPLIYCPEIDTISCHLPDPIKDISAWVEDACSSFTIEKRNIDIEDYACESGEFRAKKTVTYVAIDNYNNESRPCEHTLVYKAFDLSDVQFPTDMSIACADASLYDMNNDEKPDPELTGFPLYQNHPINGSEGHCSLEIGFEDQIVPQCGSSYKILRKWTVLDWCLPKGEGYNNPLFGYQVIQVVDELGPTMICIEEVKSYDSDGVSCGLSRLKVEMPEIGSGCGSGNFTYDFAYRPVIDGEDPYDNVTKAEAVEENGEFWIYNMPGGRSWITCTAYDECGNEASCYYEVIIDDYNAPIPVCEENNSVTLSSDGKAKVFAASFDNGSFDACSDVELSVKRLSLSECTDSTEVDFAEYVEFCCLDVSSDHQVMLQVEDSSGNKNTCTVNVSIVENVAPRFRSHPPHQTVYCYENLEEKDMGKPTIAEDCAVYSIDYTDQYSSNQCKVGSMVRRWSLRNNQNVILDSYDQHIQILIETPFEMHPYLWPEDYISDSDCSLDAVDPEITGSPNIDSLSVGCSLLVANHSDEEFLSEENACSKILRKWTVIDWCQYDESKPESTIGIWSYTQKLEFHNTVPPQFENNCMIKQINGPTGDCSVSVEFTANVSDDCTPLNELMVDYIIEFENGDTTHGQGIRFASNSVPFGTHAIKWVVKDQCGNSATCRDTFIIEDNVPPIAVCRGELTTVISASSNDVEIWANDLDLSSVDNCLDNELTFLIKKANTQDTLSSMVSFDCEEIGLQEVEVWVFDNSDNADFCRSQIEIQANHRCDSDTNSQGFMDIEGAVMTSSNKLVEDVDIELYQVNTDAYYKEKTDLSGQFHFPSMVMGDNYQVSAHKEDDPLNGVSTLDLVLIQNHIVGNRPFTDPYKIIASDISNNGSLSASDIVILRKVLLGLDETFPNNTSWRFVNSSQEFFDPTSPWPFSEFIDILDLKQSNAVTDFIAVKIGDVNDSASPSSILNQVETRNSKETTIIQSQIEANNLLTVTLKPTEEISLRGIQFSADYDHSKYELVNIESELQNFSDEHYHAKDGKLNVSWNHSNSQKLTESGFLVVRFKQLDHEKTSDKPVMSLINNRLRGELYTDQYQRVGLKIELESILQAGFDFQIGQNPFINQTNIIIDTELFEHESVLQIFDESGNLVFRQALIKGDKHSIAIQANQLSGSGIYFCQLAYGKQKITKKIVCIQ